MWIHEQEDKETLVGCRGGQRKVANLWEGLGFWDLELFNLTLLARRTWRIIRELNLLSARILKAVYFPETSLLVVTVGSHPSQIWRSIIEGWDVIAQGLIRRIGDDATNEIWGHNWLSREGLTRATTSPLSANVFLLKELIDETFATSREELI